MTITPPLAREIADLLRRPPNASDCDRRHVIITALETVNAAGWVREPR